MSIFAQPNSFFQIGSQFNFGCQDPIAMCLPILEEPDLHGFFLMTNDSPTVPPESEDDPTYPLISYCYRLVRDCAEPVIFQDIVKHYTQFFYVNNSAINQWILLPFNDDDDEPDVIPGFDFQCGECFYIQIIKTTRYENEDQETEFDPFLFRNEIIGCIGCFKKICDPCYTTLIYYRGDNAFGFNNNNRTFNQIRLPFYFKEPQFPSVKNVFTKSNGVKVKLSSRVENEWLAETDYMPKEWHEKLAIALEMDDVRVTNTNANFTNQRIMLEAGYQIDWPQFLNHPTAKANFKAFKYPYNNVNSNCF